MFRKEIQFWGRIVSEDGVSVTLKGIHCEAQWPVPRNRKDVETFLGYMNYHREHIKDYAALASPLYDLKKSKSTFVWGEAQDHTSQSLRQAMSQPGVLAFPKSHDLFTLDADVGSFIGCKIVTGSEWKRSTYKLCKQNLIIYPRTFLCNKK